MRVLMKQIFSALLARFDDEFVMTQVVCLGG